jgi:hypothetical protein
LWLPGDFFHVRDHFIEAFGLLGELCLVYEGIAIHFDYWGGFVDEEMMLVVFIYAMVACALWAPPPSFLPSFSSAQHRNPLGGIHLTRHPAV